MHLILPKLQTQVQAECTVRLLVEDRGTLIPVTETHTQNKFTLGKNCSITSRTLMYTAWQQGFKLLTGLFCAE